jgi:hypothetical protein
MTVGRLLVLAVLAMAVSAGAAQASSYYSSFSNAADWSPYWDGTSYPSPVLPGKLLTGLHPEGLESFQIQDYAHEYDMSAYTNTRRESGWWQFSGYPAVDYSASYIDNYNNDVGTATVTLDGTTFSTTYDLSRGESYEDALDKLSSDIAKWIAGRFLASSGQSPYSALHRALSLAMGQVLIPAKLPGIMKAAPGSATVTQDTVNPDGSPVVAQMPASVVTWNTSANSALRYEHIWYDDSDADGDRLGATFHYNRMWDRFSLDVIVPIDRMWFDDELEPFEFTRLGVNATPRYYALFQEEHGFDLTLGVNAFYFHTFLDDENTDDPDHVGLGPTLSVQKDFEKASVNAGLIFQRAWNAEGGLEVTGEDYVDAMQFGVNVGVPMGERFVANFSAIYSYTFDIPDGIDDDYITLGVGGTWIVSDKWVLDATVRSNVGYNEADNVELHLGMSWAF